MDSDFEIKIVIAAICVAGSWVLELIFEGPEEDDLAWQSQENDARQQHAYDDTRPQTPMSEDLSYGEYDQPSDKSLAEALEESIAYGEVPP